MSSPSLPPPLLCLQSMYATLPGLLDSNPFSESGVLRVPAGVSAVLEVLQGALQLLQAFQVHGQISSQLLAYLFFFANASLFNTLMERGEHSFGAIRSKERCILWWEIVQVA